MFISKNQFGLMPGRSITEVIHHVSLTGGAVQLGRFGGCGLELTIRWKWSVVLLAR